MCKVVSEVYEDHTDIWGRNRYPLRVKIQLIPNLTRDMNSPIPISLLLREANSTDEIQIEPFLKNIWITKVTEEQYTRLKALIKNGTS